MAELIYSHEVQNMCVVAKGPNHGPAPIPEEGAWVKAKEIKDISGLTHGIGWCAPQQGACKLTLNVKEGIIQEALVEGKLACALLGSTPTNTVCKTGNILDFLCLYPCALFGNGCGTVVRTLGYYTHILNFVRIDEFCHFIYLLKIY